jgi:hypothetical protein
MRWVPEPGQRLQERGLPGSVRADDGDQLAPVDVKREAAKDVAVAVARNEIPHLQKRDHRAVPR